MGLLSRLLGHRQEDKTAIPERSILGIGVAMTSRDLAFSEADATGVYAQRNPSWSRRQPIRFFVEHCIEPTTPAAMTAALGRIVKSPFAQEFGACTAIVQECELTVPAGHGRAAVRGACVLVTFCESADGKKHMVMLHGTPIVFKNDLSEIRQA